MFKNIKFSYILLLAGNGHEMEQWLLEARSKTVNGVQILKGESSQIQN